jgi:hypothetical protein
MAANQSERQSETYDKFCKNPTQGRRWSCGETVLERKSEVCVEKPCDRNGASAKPSWALMLVDLDDAGTLQL